MLPEVIADLRANSVIDAALDSTVTDAIEGLFAIPVCGLRLQSAVVGLVSEVLGDSSVQDAVSDQVQQLVSSALGRGALGDAVGAQVGAAVVGLMTNSVIGEGVAEPGRHDRGWVVRQPGRTGCVGGCCGEVGSRRRSRGIFRRCCRR